MRAFLPSVRRCCFESAVSSELLSRLAAYPKLRAVLDALGRPKMISLSSTSEPRIAKVDTDATALDSRVKHVVTSLQSAAFTGSAVHSWMWTGPSSSSASSSLPV